MRLSISCVGIVGPSSGSGIGASPNFGGADGASGAGVAGRLPRRLCPFAGSAVASGVPTADGAGRLPCRLCPFAGSAGVDGGVPPTSPGVASDDGRLPLLLPPPL